MIPNWTLVLGVDEKHLSQLGFVIPTWKRFKPSLFEKPWIIFYDESVKDFMIEHLLQAYGVYDYYLYSWPPDGVTYEGDMSNKFSNPQRYRMLAGFVHVAAKYVKTKYWLKIDTDTIASGMDDWVLDEWFENEPAIISHPWGFTKPPNQMMDLDEWFNYGAYDVIINFYYRQEFGIPYISLPSLDIVPTPGRSRVGHKRIISWCGFFNTSFTKFCSNVAGELCGKGKLPVPSQDGYVWYMAKRCGFGIIRMNFKSRGWIHRSSMKGIRQAVEKVME